MATFIHNSTFISELLLFGFCIFNKLSRVVKSDARVIDLPSGCMCVADGAMSFFCLNELLLYVLVVVVVEEESCTHARTNKTRINFREIYKGSYCYCGLAKR